MGQTLSEPITTKETLGGESKKLKWAVSSMQGWRINMEDAHTAIEEMEGDLNHAFFGVFDGHGGQNVAKYCGNRLHQLIGNDGAFRRKDYEQAIKNGFLGIDNEIRADFANETSGCTAVIAIFTDDGRVFVGNAGDSRIIISEGGVAIALSTDHKPGLEGETMRIVAAGGFVEFGRVNGNLALSRAIGDFEFKQNKMLDAEQQIVTANPDVTSRKITENDEFLVVACDGIWDCLSNQEVVAFIRRGLASKWTLEQICEQIMDRCLASDSDLGGVGCDNMTIIIIAILGGRTMEQWTAWVSEGVQPLVESPPNS